MAAQDMCYWFNKYKFRLKITRSKYQQVWEPTQQQKKQKLGIINQKLYQTRMFKQSVELLATMNTFLLIPLYVCLAPLCMVSSSLLDWILSWVYCDQAVTLVGILIFEWGVSALLIFQLMYNRRGKSIFFYEFVFFLVCANFILIGTSYSLLHRYDILEQFAAKVCTSLILILAAERMKIKFNDNESDCSICLERMNEQCIILKCKHYFHETCLWEWSYVKQQCPSCRQPIS